MSASAEAITTYKPEGTLALWLLMGIYAVARGLQVYPGRTPMLTVVALHVAPPALFALLHGSRLYGWRGIGVFAAICLFVGDAVENVGIRSGFPFGHYYFTDLMGPKISGVPVLLALAYVGMAYLSWVLACSILGLWGARAESHARLVLPLLASSIMVSWDLSQDPIWSTVLRAWTWQDGGVYFGVPVSNFLGWFLTVYVIFQMFAIYLFRFSHSLPVASPSYLRPAVLFYAISAAGNLLLLLPNKQAAVVFDPAGIRWRVRSLTEACALVTLLTMGSFAILAWKRTADQHSAMSSRQSVA
ncbi:MAG TPA: carotenoid biosynthesis protein [Candidatus Bathyarchaeia archaeon]|nr:carotenoid biosynthesis protein [Candidatus Bathyarchaeia archaeon]